MSQRISMTEQELIQIKQYFSDMENQTREDQNESLFSAMEIVSKFINIELMLEPDYIHAQLSKYNDRVIQLLGFDKSEFFDEDESESFFIQKVEKLLNTYDAPKGFTFKRFYHIIHMAGVYDVVGDIEWCFRDSRLGDIYELDTGVLGKIGFAVNKKLDLGTKV